MCSFFLHKKHLDSFLMSTYTGTLPFPFSLAWSFLDSSKMHSLPVPLSVFLPTERTWSSIHWLSIYPYACCRRFWRVHTVSGECSGYSEQGKTQTSQPLGSSIELLYLSFSWCPHAHLSHWWASAIKPLLLGCWPMPCLKSQIVHQRTSTMP